MKGWVCRVYAWGGGEAGLQHLHTDHSASVPPCSLPASYQGLESVVEDPVFGVGQVAAATTQKTGGFYRGVPTTACALLLSPLLTLLRLLVRSSS